MRYEASEEERKYLENYDISMYDRPSMPVRLFPKLDTMRWGIPLQRIHVTLAIYVTGKQSQKHICWNFCKYFLRISSTRRNRHGKYCNWQRNISC